MNEATQIAYLQAKLEETEQEVNDALADSAHWNWQLTEDLKWARAHFSDHPAAHDPYWQAAMIRLAEQEAELEATLARGRAITEKMLAQLRAPKN